jgi:hypothetical protein
VATGRDRAASLAQRITDEFRRSGILPPELVRELQARHARRTGEIVTYDEVAKAARLYAEEICARADALVPTTPKRQMEIDQAVEILMSFTPTSKPARWAEALAIVEQAWKEGRLSPAQTVQLDALNALYEAS